MRCSNCQQDVTGNPLLLMHGGNRVAVICEDCLTGVQVGKIVFKRAAGNVVYEGYLPVQAK